MLLQRRKATFVGGTTATLCIPQRTVGAAAAPLHKQLRALQVAARASLQERGCASSYRSPLNRQWSLGERALEKLLAASLEELP